MEKRALLAVVLSIIVLGLWQAFMAPHPPAPPPEPQESQEGLPAEPAGSPTEAPAVEPREVPSALEPSSETVAAEEAHEFIVETDLYSIRLDNSGGRILSWRLLAYVDDLQAPIEIIPRNLPAGGEFPLRVAVPGDAAATAALDGALWAEEVREAGPGEEWPSGDFEGTIVSFTWADGRGLRAVKRLALSRDGYVGHVSAEVSRDGLPAPVRLTWAVGLPAARNGSTRAYWRAEGQGVIHAGGQVERFKAAKTTSIVQRAASPAGGAIRWGGLESTYFATLLLPGDPTTARMSFTPVAAPPADGGDADEETPLLAAAFEADGPVRLTTLVGPKDYDLLSGTGRELELAIDFSRFSLIYVLTKYLFLALRWIHGWVGNYGFAIILLTIILRVGFFPLMYRSSITMRRNAKKMQKIQPRVKAIQERYKKAKRTVESQKKMNDEIMAVYRKEGMNPMGSLGGCLPLLIQMPFFLAFYNLLSVTIEMRGAPFILWVQDLSQMDPWYVLPILMGASWMVQQAMTSSSIPDPMQRRIMGLMPLMFTFMMLNMPSGLVLYWLMSNLLGLIQQYVINRQADKMPA